MESLWHEPEEVKLYGHRDLDWLLRRYGKQEIRRAYRGTRGQQPIAWECAELMFNMIVYDKAEWKAVMALFGVTRKTVRKQVDRVAKALGIDYRARSIPGIS